MLGGDSDATETNDHQSNEPSDLRDRFSELDAQNSSPDCYTQVLILHLRHYAQEQARLGVASTDEMFQQEARRLLFDSDDPWNQTIADRPEWLAVFREQHLHRSHALPGMPYQMP
jgi:hypothetical protein